MKPKLFLLKSDFLDNSAGEAGQSYFCSDCTLIEGLLSYYPQLRNKLEVRYVDFEKPRKEIAELIGEKNQSCPVLIYGESEKSFLNTNSEIIEYLSENFGIGKIHP